MDQNPKILAAWEKRNKLRARGEKLSVHKLCKLCTESYKLCTEGGIIFLDAVRKEYGDIGLSWKNWNEEHQSYECHLDNGEVYGF